MYWGEPGRVSVSMAIGYLGLRYIELSISSPICNSSGAIVAVLVLATDGVGSSTPLQLAAVACVCLGVVALGVTEATEDEDLRKARQDEANRHYAKSWIAITIPIIYCLLDALGTFADSRVLMSAANEAAVGLFLGHRLGYNQIYDCAAGAVASIKNVKDPGLDDILETDRAARAYVMEHFA